MSGANPPLPAAYPPPPPAQVGAIIVSVIILLLFAVTLITMLFRLLPAANETMLNIVLGCLTAMATQVPAYWMGSSASSARKDHMQMVASPPPAPPVP